MANIEKITDETVIGSVKWVDCDGQHGVIVFPNSLIEPYRTRLLTSAEKDAKIKELEEELSGQHEKALMDGAEIRELTAKLKVAESMLDEAMRIICDTIKSMKISLGISTDLNRNFTLELYIDLMEKEYEALKKLKG